VASKGKRGDNTSEMFLEERDHHNHSLTESVDLDISFGSGSGTRVNQDESPSESTLEAPPNVEALEVISPLSDLSGNNEEFQDLQERVSSVSVSSNKENFVPEQVVQDVSPSPEDFLDSTEASSVHQYHLTGVIHHLGPTSTSGHYIAYVKT
jgi:hypothetical protein